VWRRCARKPEVLVPGGGLRSADRNARRVLVATRHAATTGCAGMRHHRRGRCCPARRSGDGALRDGALRPWVGRASCRAAWQVTFVPVALPGRSLLEVMWLRSGRPRRQSRTWAEVNAVRFVTVRFAGIWCVALQTGAGWTRVGDGTRGRAEAHASGCQWERAWTPRLGGRAEGDATASVTVDRAGFPRFMAIAKRRNAKASRT